MAWGTPTVGSFVENIANTSLAPPAPSGSGGVLLMLCYNREGSGSTANLPTGWTALASDNYNLQCFGRDSDGGANDNPTVTFGSTAAVHCLVQIRWPGGSLTTNGSSSTWWDDGSAKATGYIVLPEVTEPSVDNCLIIRMGATKNDDSTGSATASNGSDTMLIDHNTATAGTQIWAAAVYRIQTTKAAIGDGDEINMANNTGENFSLAFVLQAGAGATTKYLKLLAHSSAAGASSVAGTVFNAPSGADITGSKIGEFTGASFLGANSLDGGKAKLLVNVSSFGGSSLTTANTPQVYVRTSSFDVGIAPATVIEV